MSGDPEQEYFVDGMVDDIITGLSRIKWLFVIARNSSFIYRGRAVDVKQVGRELGVRYVLEGSVRRSEIACASTAQLVDASSGAHVWAERYDRILSDMFALQDEIALVGCRRDRAEPAPRRSRADQPQAAGQSRRLRSRASRTARRRFRHARSCRRRRCRCCSARWRSTRPTRWPMGSPRCAITTASCAPDCRKRIVPPRSAMRRRRSNTATMTRWR